MAAVAPTALDRPCAESALAADPPIVDSGRVLADLRELERRTGGPRGAQRLCWGEGWQVAREFLAELLGEIGLGMEVDEAGNAWSFLGDREEPALILGSHLDSVPDGGWLDGALGVIAALGVLRAWAEFRSPLQRRLGLVDWADEEGARFGRSLFGSSAVAGTLNPAELANSRDAEGRLALEILADNGVALEEVPAARSRLAPVAAYLELHIEQGPRLDELGLAASAVVGCVGIERFRLTIDGHASHAGTTPMDRRADAALAAAEVALEVERIANETGGTATTGQLILNPGVPTVIAGSADLAVDLRHPSPEALAEMLARARAVAASVGVDRGCRVAETPIWRISPIDFDPDLVAAASAVADGQLMTSGALHDAAEMAQAGVPTAMLFCPSIGGVSHSREENTREADLIESIGLFGQLVADVMRLERTRRS